MDTLTAGISPGFASTCSTPTGRPITAPAASISSRTLVDRPVPMMTLPPTPAR